MQLNGRLQQHRGEQDAAGIAVGFEQLQAVRQVVDVKPLHLPGEVGGEGDEADRPLPGRRRRLTSATPEQNSAPNHSWWGALFSSEGSHVVMASSSPEATRQSGPRNAGSRPGRTTTP